MSLTPEQLNALHYESLTDARTIAKMYAGGPVRTLARARIVKAARKLKLKLPPGVK